MRTCTTSAPAIMSCFPRAKISRKSYAQHATQPGADTAPETAPHTASCTTSFRAPVHSDLLQQQRDSRTSLQTCTLDCATLWLSYSIGWATSWPSHSVGCLLVTLPLDCAIQWWVTFWLLYNLLYNLTELFNYELPLDYSTSWLSYPIARNYGNF